jgi:arginine/lysine/ornithine decarboxylase
MAHTSTSPNYQILASLDLGSRQVALEGVELVQRQIENAMQLRDAIDDHPLLSRYMECLRTSDLIPDEFRPSGIAQPLRSGLRNMMAAWKDDEFVLDPSRITLSIGRTGYEVPGQVVSRQILALIRDLDTPEIHGYKPDFGYRVYTEKAIEMCRPADAPIGNGRRPVAAGAGYGTGIALPAVAPSRSSSRLALRSTSNGMKSRTGLSSNLACVSMTTLATMDCAIAG